MSSDCEDARGPFAGRIEKFNLEKLAESRLNKNRSLHEHNVKFKKESEALGRLVHETRAQLSASISENTRLRKLIEDLDDARDAMRHKIDLEHELAVALDLLLEIQDSHDGCPICAELICDGDCPVGHATGNVSKVLPEYEISWSHEFALYMDSQIDWMTYEAKKQDIQDSRATAYNALRDAADMDYEHELATAHDLIRDIQWNGQCLGCPECGGRGKHLGSCRMAEVLK